MNSPLLFAAAAYADAVVAEKVTQYAISETRAADLAKIRHFEDHMRQREQIQFRTEHAFHAGMYARTVRIPSGVVFTSVLIKRATLLILNGSCDVLVGSTGVRFEGYNVIPASAGRKTVYVTRSAIELTMIFPSNSRTVAEAEAEFTDEGDILLSRTNQDDIVIVTGEHLCLESLPQPRS